jgi:hypothetical protein
MDYKALLLSNQQYLIPALAALLSFLGGRASVGTTPRSEVCNPEIQALQAAERQLSQLEQSLQRRVLEATQECREAEEAVCATKLQEFKDACEQLHCSICEGRGR